MDTMGTSSGMSDPMKKDDDMDKGAGSDPMKPEPPMTGGEGDDGVEDGSDTTKTGAMGPDVDEKEVEGDSSNAM